MIFVDNSEEMNTEPISFLSNNIVGAFSKNSFRAKRCETIVAKFSGRLQLQARMKFGTYSSAFYDFTRSSPRWSWERPNEFEAASSSVKQKISHLLNSDPHPNDLSWGWTGHEYNYVSRKGETGIGESYFFNCLYDLVKYLKYADWNYRAGTLYVVTNAVKFKDTPADWTKYDINAWK